MRNFNINGKELPIPSFFQVYNYGGGAGDKCREIVYANLTKDTPALVNYYYLNNTYPHTFQSKKLNDISKFNSIGDIFNYVRKSLVEDDHNVYVNYSLPEYDFNQKIFLLDSGASQIVKYIAKEIDYNKEAFLSVFIQHMIAYYDFADRYKFDLVVGFDLGGKYTFKDGEADKKLLQFYNSLDKDEINYTILKSTIDYLKTKPNFYPKVLATIHGKTPNDYKQYTLKTLELEKSSGYSFWGFALGGIASSKNADESWSNGIDFSKTKKKFVSDAVTPARASYIVHSIVGDRPIHALGGGGYPNILLNSWCGATSFDAASPARRVGDGNALSTGYVFDKNAPKKLNGADVSFSKLFVGGVNFDGTLRDESFEYLDLNKVDNNFTLCGCPACEITKTVIALKELYASKSGNDEATYFSRQLMNIHAIWQHRLLCQIISKYTATEFIEKYGQDNLFSRLLLILEQIKRMD